MDEVCGAATYVAVGGGHFTANLTVNYVNPLWANVSIKNICLRFIYNSDAPFMNIVRIIPYHSFIVYVYLFPGVL